MASPPTSSMTNISSLPDDVLKLILKYLPCHHMIEWLGDDNQNWCRIISTWFNVMLTCKRFLGCGREVFDPSIDDNDAIVWAAISSNVHCIRSLLKDPRVDPSARSNAPIIGASEFGRTKIVRELLKDPRVDPSARKNQAIIWAIENDHVRVVKYLMRDPRVDPSTDNNRPLRYAANNDNVKIVKQLLKDKRVDPNFDPFTLSYIYISSGLRGNCDVFHLLTHHPRFRKQ